MLDNQDSITPQEQTTIARLIRLEVYMEEARKNAMETQAALSRIEGKMEAQSAQNSQLYITRQEFGPIRALVYGFVSIILTSVIGALIYLVVKRPV